MTVGGGTDGRSGSRVPVQPAAVLPGPASVIFQLHGESLMELAMSWQAYVDRPALVQAGRDLEVSLGWLRATAAAQREAQTSDRGNAEVPRTTTSANSASISIGGDHLETSEVAEMLKVSPRQVTNLIRNKRLSATLLGSRWLIDPLSVASERLRREIEGRAV